ncbi:MAG: hypothetical protein WCT24_03505 [Patescibacteria group bacterium]|jgi:hypothetical protein
MTASSKPVNLPTASTLIAQTIRLYGQHARWYVGYASWLFVPLVLLLLSSLVLSGELFELMRVMTTSVVEPILICIVLILCFFLTNNILDGKKIHAKKMSKQTLAVLAPYLLTTIAYTILVGLGFIAFIVPGILLATLFAFVKPILLFEQAPIIDAFKQSTALVRPHFFPILRKLLLADLCLIAVLTFGFTLVALASIGLSGLSLQAYLETPPSLIESVLTQCVIIFALPLIPIYSTVFYNAIKKTNL